MDYVVLTAAATGLAIAASTELSDGLTMVTDVVATELALQGEDVSTDQVTIYDDTFANASSGWTGGQVSDVFGLGMVLGPIANTGDVQAVTKRFEVGPGMESVTLDFEVYAMDDLESDDSGYVYIGGKKVGAITREDGKAVFTAIETVDDVAITANILEDDVELGGSLINVGGSKDSKIAFSITVTDPGTSVDFGFGAPTSAGADNESFAIDNFTVTGKKADDTTRSDPSV
ncbi:MAG: hypothetical protein AAF264_07020 [Pseudomonadota bacterium]